MTDVQEPSIDQEPSIHPISEVGALSPAEERFERIRQATGLVLGPLAFIVMWLIPFPGLSPEAHHLAAVVSLVVMWWVTEAIPIPMTALFGAGLTVLFGVSTAKEAFAPFATPVIFLFIGAFMLGQAIVVHGLDQRAAVAVLSMKSVQGNLTRIRLALAALCLGISAWLSNTATAAMVLPMALGVLTSCGVFAAKGARRYTSGFLLTLGYAASLGGIMTPVGTAPNLITIGLLEELAGVRVDFLTWMMMAVPIGIALAAVMVLVVDRLFPGVSSLEVNGAPIVVRVQKAERAPWTLGQRYTLFAFAVAIALWITPSVYGLLPDAFPGRTVVGRFDEGVSALLAASLLFLLPVNWQKRQFALNWTDASKIDWGTILLFGGGLSLGEQMFRTGLAESIGLGLVAFTGAETLWGITAMAILLAIVLTEITSNTAATNMLVPVIISICAAAGVSPLPPALGACLGASMAFMLPISTPPNAIVYGTGFVRITEMVKFGLVLDVIAFFVVFAGLRVLCPLLGLI
jgi:solute carrier family 13 (sodium-dependent dicarboxylate transporter), member 2/3/5